MIKLIRIDGVVVVEGKYDRINLQNYIDATIVTTNGFQIFKDKEKQKLLRFLTAKSGAVIITDSDDAGAQIRAFLKNICKNSDIKNVYLPQIRGKEKRKSAPSKQGFLGAEGLSGEIILAALKKAGDENPSFMDAVTDLTAGKCRSLADSLAEFDYQGAGVYTQSFGSCMKKASSGAFPLNMSYLLAKYFDGPNDGLVGEASFIWGENYVFLENKGSRGISHGDMIDLNRENIPGFDVREFFVELVSDLKKRGL